MKIVKRDGVFVHAADQLGRSDAIPVVADERNFHEIFKADSTEEVNKFILWPFCYLLLRERDVQGAFKVTHCLLPERMSLLELLALVRKSVERKVICSCLEALLVHFASLAHSIRCRDSCYAWNICCKKLFASQLC